MLGICVGMQVMFTEGVEHGERTPGLDQWPGSVDPLDAPVVPHMGWSQVEPPADTRLFAGVERERFYFVHSYAVQSDPAASFAADGASVMELPKITWASHGGRFVAAVENGALSATQFHPEKSGDAGARLLRNWVVSLPASSR